VVCTFTRRVAAHSAAKIAPVSVIVPIHRWCERHLAEKMVTVLYQCPNTAIRRASYR